MSGHLKEIDVVGEVLEADVKQKQFQLWLSDRRCVFVSFSESQEDEVIAALKDHKLVRMRVKGRGEMSPQGGVLKVTAVEKMLIQPASGAAADHSDRPIEEILAELASEVPQAEWDKLPSDLTDNLDHYLYGTPKR